MSQSEKARVFKALHVKAAPLVLYNIWDAGSAKVVADAGAQAIATGSWSVAAAFGFGDGEAIPLEDVLANARRVVGATELPVSIDFEGAYAVEPERVSAHVGQLVETGAIGINFEDQVIGGEGLYGIDTQAARIAGAREATALPFFINARTDVYLKADAGADLASLLPEVIERAAAYEEAGADGFFVPGLADLDLIARICEATPLPVNVMMKPGMPDVETLASAGVARISHGPGPYRMAMNDLQARFQGI